MLWETVAGCTPVSAGCANCYAAKSVATTHRHERGYAGLAVLNPAGAARWHGHVNLLPHNLPRPGLYARPSMVYANLMSDTFHPGVSFAYINRMVDIVAANPRHRFQFLTRRADRMARYCRARGALPANLWVGVSVENMDCIGRVDWLRKINAAVRFISFEPLLSDMAGADLSGVDWAMIGPECGQWARPAPAAWISGTIAACRAHNVPVMVEQLGPGMDSRQHWPAEFALHEWPRGGAA